MKTGIKNTDIKMFLGRFDITLSEAMKKIDKNLQGIIFLTNNREQLIGSVTDGDIRRYLISGGNINDSVYLSANKNPKFASDIDEACKIYNGNNHIIVPIINTNLNIVDIYFGPEKTQAKKRNKINLPVVINAGGRGSRLDPFTKVLPKPLIPVGEIPIIELIMKEFLEFGCNDFHIIVNYKKELMKAYFADANKEYKVTWYDEDKPLGTGGGLSLLKGKLKGSFFFVNCDVLLKVDYGDILSHHKKEKNVITMVCANKSLNIPYGVVKAQDDNQLLDMEEKPSYSFLTNTGIYILESEILKDIVDETAIGFPDIVELEKDKGRRVGVYTVNEDAWMDMGQLSELEKMRKKLYGE